MEIYGNKIFKDPIQNICAFRSSEIESCFKTIEEFRKKDLYLLGYIRYDLKKDDCKDPLIYFNVYDSYEEFNYDENLVKSKKIGIIKKPLITFEQYQKSIDVIKQKILDGITYEVNFTYPYNVKTNATDLELFYYLLNKQNTPYKAYLNNQYETVLSFSPELFFKLDKNKIITKPMKGTIARGNSNEDDEKRINFLKTDPKNTAENIMIVDLLRNDLGRIAKTGSVKVDKLFEVEKHETVLQMTSTISALLENNVSLYDIFKSIYPCGSITGAPKLATIDVIKDVEKYDREIYCGAIGLIHQDNAEFSVPIRILQRVATQSDYTYFVGVAITWNSDTKDEWNETITKASFIDSDFHIFETFIDDLPIHLKRFKKAAFDLNFKWNKDIETYPYESNLVNHVDLYKDGTFEVSTREIPKKIEKPKVKIRGVVNSHNPFLYYKTSIRYDSPKDCFDNIFVNEKGEITEGSFTNVAILKDGKYFTPPISCGLLNGTYREKMNFTQKVLTIDDLKSADKVFLMNDIRGLIEVELCY